MPGQRRIYSAGEKDYLTCLERKGKGVPLNKSLQNEFKQMRDELELTGYNLPF